MKRAVVIILVTVTLFTGCGRRGIEENEYRRFKMVATYGDGYEIVDKDTGFSYFVFSGGGGVVPLYDEEGHLYRANGWNDYAP